MDIDLERTVKLQTKESEGSSKKNKLPFPSPIKVRTILSKFCDVQGPIMKKTVQSLARLSTDDESKKK